jgi:hypothetical protein
VQQVARAASARFDERLAERTRIAGELHDAFLQTVEGSKLVADHALKRSSDPDRLPQVVPREDQTPSTDGSNRTESRLSRQHARLPMPGQANVLTHERQGAVDISMVETIHSISLTVFSVISDLLFLHLIYNYIQFVETLFPESAIADRPVADCLYRLWPKRAHTLSSTLRLDYNPRPHQGGR